MCFCSAVKLRAMAAIASLSSAALLAAPPLDVDAAAPPGSWHVYVYIVNDSEGQLPYGQDIDEMLMVSQTSGIDFTVYLDGSETAGPMLGTSALPNTNDALVIEITDGALTVTQSLGELDSGHPDTLAWFLAQGLLAHPNEKAALVVWDHGAGWRGVGFDEDVTATGSRRGSSLDTADLSLAIGNGLAAAQREQLDLLVYDACLMASYDILGSAQGHADYVIASEEVIPGLGLDYGAWEVLTRPGVDAATIFDAVATTYVTEVADAQPGADQDYTLSMFDINQTTAIGAAITQFANAAAIDVYANPTPYIQATTQVRRYGISGDFWYGFVDLGEYLNVLDGVSPEVATARDNLLTAISNALVGQRNGTPVFDAATGMTIYFPNEPRDFDSDFQALATAGPWMPFLEAFYNAQAGVVLQTDVGFAAETLTVAPVVDDPGWYQISVPVTANFVGSVQLVAATTDANGVRTFFETDDGAVDGTTASALILPSLTTVSDGTRQVVPYTRYVIQPDGQHGYSTFTLRRAGGSVAQLNWDRRGGDGSFTVVDDNGVVVAYTPQPGDLAYPVSLVQQPGGAAQLVATDTPLDPNRQWTVSDELIPAGTEVYLELRLLDANGNVIDLVTGTLIAGQ
jgi:hypothetical protein